MQNKINIVLDNECWGTRIINKSRKIMEKKIYAPVEGLIKFENKEQTKKWFKENWKKRLIFSDQKEIFDDFIHPESDTKSEINDYLKRTTGQLVDTNEPNNELYQKLLKEYTPKEIETINKNIEKLDVLIWRNEIPDSMYVYEFVNERRFSLPVNSIRGENGQIDFAAFKRLKTKYLDRTLQKTTYLEVSFDEKETHFMPVMFEYAIEKGTHGLYYDNENHNEPKMLLERNQWIQINDISIVRDEQTENAEIIKLKCVLVDNPNLNENQDSYFI